MNFHSEFFQPDDRSCLPVCLAYYLNVTLGEMLSWIGHDGSAIVLPDAPGTEGCICFPFWKTMFEVNKHRRISVFALGDKIETPWGNIIATNPLPDYCVLVGRVNGNDHAVIHKCGLIYDPNGEVYERNEFEVDYFIV